MAATATLLEEAQKIVMGHKLVIQVPHEVSAILTQKAGKYLTPAQYSHYEVALLGNPEIEVRTCSTLNPAMLIPELEREPCDHDCLDVLEEELPIRKNLKDRKIENADLDLYVDGSSYVLNGK